MTPQQAIHKLLDGRELASGEAELVMRAIMEGQATAAQIGAILVLLSQRGESVEEITGFARVMREKALRVRPHAALVLDTCGTGGDGAGTFNISTLAAIVRYHTASPLETFSISFSESGFDESPFQDQMARYLGTRHHVVHATHADIGRVFPDVVWHTERPILRTAPAPLFLLSRLVRNAGIKAVLTGEGADEVLGGYDIFREAKVREFWARRPESQCRPRLFDRLYPYLARSPRRARGMAVEFWRQGLDRAGTPGFSHDPRWRTTAMLKRFFSRETTAALGARPMPDLLASLPPEFGAWDPIGQAQYLEVTSLLSSYLISSQGDRMLMAHSVEGRFPFLDAEVMDFCNNLPPRYKIAGLTEKYLLKRMARGMIPSEIIERQKQPYRAPDAISFVHPAPPAYVQDLLSEESVRRAGLFDPPAVCTLLAKLTERGKTLGQRENFSNTDNMALIGVLSTQLVVRQFIEGAALHDGPPVRFTTMIDRQRTPHEGMA